MKKKTYLFSDEIDLIDTLKIIWGGKIIIFFTLILSILLLIGYETNNKPKNNLYSYTYRLDLNQLENSDFIKAQYNKFLYQEFLSQNILDIKNISIMEIFSENFLREMMDHEELYSVVKKYINDGIMNETKFYSQIYNQLLDDSNKDIINFIPGQENIYIKITWIDDKEINNILDHSIKLTISNLKNSLFQEIDLLLKLREDYLKLNDQVYLNFLLEQSSIARKLNIKDNSLGSSVDNNSFYLRGYIVIDEIINKIKKRDYQNDILIVNEFDSLKKSNKNFVDYNLSLIEKKPIEQNSNFKLNLIISIILGLLAGILIVIIKDLIKSRTSSRKKKFYF